MSAINILASSRLFNFRCRRKKVIILVRLLSRAKAMRHTYINRLRSTKYEGDILTDSKNLNLNPAIWTWVFPSSDHFRFEHVPS